MLIGGKEISGGKFKNCLNLLNSSHLLALTLKHNSKVLIRMLTYVKRQAFSFPPSSSLILTIKKRGLYKRYTLMQVLAIFLIEKLT